MSLTDHLVFWCNPDDDEGEEDVGFETTMLLLDENDLDESNSSNEGKVKESMYVSLVEGMVKTVLEQESFLFSDEELAFFRSYTDLSYKARYILARLLVRKSGKWYRLNQLKYVSELGTEGIIEAMKELCITLISGSKEPNKSCQNTIQKSSMCESPPGVVIDLISDDDLDHGIDSQQVGPSISAGNVILEDNHEIRPVTQRRQRSIFDFYAEDESAASVTELLNCLTLEELKGIARSLKLSNVLTTRKALIEALMASASAQTTLSAYAPSPSSNSRPRKTAKDFKSAKYKQALLSFSPNIKPQVQMDILRNMALKLLRHCIRINGAINAMFHRLHIIYFRSMEHPTSLLTPALLRRCRKRFYPLYTHTRTPSIFRSREELIAYEEALRMEAAVDMILEGSIDVELAEEHINAWANNCDRKETFGLPYPHTLKERADTPFSEMENGKENFWESVDMQPKNCSTTVSRGLEVADEPMAPTKESQTISNARYIISIFERIYSRWRELVEQKKESNERANGLNRFDEGYILTRIVYKGATAYGKLKNFEREIELLQELLAQRWWRRGKRGLWYDRWALILMYHYARGTHKSDGESRTLSKAEQKTVLQKAVDVVMEGLQDDDTNLVNRQALEHRLARLERQLKIPEKDRHHTSELKKAVETKIIGERVRRPLALGKRGSSNKIVVPVSVQIQGQEAIKKHLEELRKERQRGKWTGKSLWYGKSGEVVNVETLVLHHYELDGYRGYHSEASIVSTIWGLIFWDILFASVPGAFETPYQSAPLDIATESFFFARKELIERRLKEIEEGKAPEILTTTDNKYRGNKTMCTGVHWDYPKQDLVEIVTYLGGPGLSVICRLLCEDYGGRQSGIPDLIVWDIRDKVAKFVEVKGPGDKLSENQKVWIDVLLRAGINIEVCHVSDKEKPNANVAQNWPKKHMLIRTYRLDGDKDNPIDLDESEDEMAVLLLEERVAQESPRKKLKPIDAGYDQSETCSFNYNSVEC